MEEKAGETNPFQNSPRQCMTISLILGDLIGAIFCLSYSLSVVPDQLNQNIDWCDFRLMGLYLFYFMPFVYSFSLATLCVELTWRRRIKTSFESSRNGSKSVFMAALPWFLGYISNAPLLFIGFDTDECSNNDTSAKYRERVAYVIALTTPSTLVCMVVLIINTLQIEDVSEYYTPAECLEVTTEKQQSVTQNSEKVSSPDRSKLVSDINVEQRALMAASCVNLLLTVPFGVFMVYHLLDGDHRQTSDNTDDIVMLMLEWMIPLRAVITPLVWWNSFLNGRNWFTTA